jgi:hypothetical protein
LVVGLVVVAVQGYAEVEEISLADQALIQAGLWFGLLGVPLWASFRKGRGPVDDFRLTMRWYDAPLGLAVGALTQFPVLPLLYLPIFWIFGEQDVSEPARELTEKATGTGTVVLLVLVVVVGAPVIEEIFFRGLLLRSLERTAGGRLGVLWPVAISSVVFGLFHFQLLQLPALVVFGLVAAVLTVRTGRLGPAIWAHVAFNATTVVVLLTESS